MRQSLLKYTLIPGRHGNLADPLLWISGIDIRIKNMEAHFEKSKTCGLRIVSAVNASTPTVPQYANNPNTQPFENFASLIVSGILEWLNTLSAH